MSFMKGKRRRFGTLSMAPIAYKGEDRGRKTLRRIRILARK
jgi:hypothetical protein